MLLLIFPVTAHDAAFPISLCCQPQPENYVHNDDAAMQKVVVERLGVHDGDVFDIRDAPKAQIETVFGTREQPRGRLAGWVRPGEPDMVVFRSGPAPRRSSFDVFMMVGGT